ncbi:DUF1338 family protein, partial [Streptomyces sp. SID10115]|uniref:2-oxoadipate dioxygenase/decarboxylase family protein n=4 Tax=unclassified Streptomyces TaxID=2593676 RepID=UPI0013C59596|nr:DUF1338 family protein [Streptomyces sp. SID10115]
AVWAEHLPATEHELAARDLGFFTYHAVPDRPAGGGGPPTDLAGLLDGGWLRAEPIVYEDFLPRSAAGIFRSNLDDTGPGDRTREGDGEDGAYDADRLSAAMGRDVLDPFALYERQRDRSLALLPHALRPTRAPRHQGAS